jgi:cysteine desulfurase
MDIYLDHNATSPLAPEALDAMLPWLKQGFGNPSSPYQLGREAKKAVDAARETIAEVLGAARPERICFTGSGSEADTMAIQGVARALRHKGNHIVTSAIEHSAILNACRALEEEGFETTYVKPDRHGMVQPDAVAAAIRGDTVLASIMHANNETGTINPIKAIVRIARQRGILVHTDAVQTFCKLPLDVQDLDVDLLSLSAHKIGGPKGVGALYTRSGVPMKPLIFGGHQENGLRAGTENVAGIVGLAAAARLEAEHREEWSLLIRSLRDRLETGLQAELPDSQVNGHSAERLPNTVNLSFPFVEAESLLLDLDLNGIAVSSGSACMSATGEPSHVLIAMGIPNEVCRGALRFSLGYENTREEIDRVVTLLPGIVRRIRAMSPLAS